MATLQEKVIVLKRNTGGCKGMPYINLREHHKGNVMIETVKKNIAEFTKREVEKAKLSRVVQQRIGHPTCEHLKEIVSQPDLKNVPIRQSDVANAKTSFGPQIPGLKERVTRKKLLGSAVVRVSIPDDFYRLKKFLTLAADLMFFSELNFL